METGREGLRDAEKNSHRLQAESVKELDDQAGEAGRGEMVEKGLSGCGSQPLGF